VGGWEAGFYQQNSRIKPVWSDRAASATSSQIAFASGGHGSARPSGDGSFFSGDLAAAATSVSGDMDPQPSAEDLAYDRQLHEQQQLQQQQEEEQQEEAQGSPEGAHNGGEDLPAGPPLTSSPATQRQLHLSSNHLNNHRLSRRSIPDLNRKGNSSNNLNLPGARQPGRQPPAQHSNPPPRPELQTSQQRQPYVTGMYASNPPHPSTAPCLDASSAAAAAAAAAAHFRPAEQSRRLEASGPQPSANKAAAIAASVHGRPGAQAPFPPRLCSSNGEDPGSPLHSPALDVVSRGAWVHSDG
jgi:hypothetical protein